AGACKGCRNILAAAQSKNVGWHVHRRHMFGRQKADDGAAAGHEHATDLAATSLQRGPEVNGIYGDDVAEGGIPKRECLDISHSKIGAPGFHRIPKSSVRLTDHLC